MSVDLFHCRHGRSRHHDSGQFLFGRNLRRLLRDGSALQGKLEFRARFPAATGFEDSRQTPPLNVFPASHPMTTTITYDNRTVRRFMTASIFWGIIGMLVGVLAATQLSWWQMNGKFLETITFGLIKSEGLSYITYGRIRPLLTNAVIFACVGNMVFAGVYYSTQRLCRCRIASDLLSTVHFWGWQSIILGAAIPLLLNFASQLGKHAEKLARGNSPTNFRREELAKTGTLQP
jgi:hypothetical protein